MLLSWISAIGLLWSGIMLLAGVKGIHEYTFGETVKSILAYGAGYAVDRVFVRLIL